MKVQVEVHSNLHTFNDGAPPLRLYQMDHNDHAQRRVLGEQCRNAFEGGQVIVTYATEALA